MKLSFKLALGALAALGLAACSNVGPIRVYVEPTYEQNRLQQLLARNPEFKVLLDPGTEDVTLRVEAVPAGESSDLPRATIHALEPRTHYEVYAVAEFLRVRNTHGGRARWVSSYADEVREDDVDQILYTVVREAARQEHRSYQRPPSQVERALHSATPDS